jgi:hypothetical protein
MALGEGGRRLSKCSQRKFGGKDEDGDMAGEARGEGMFPRRDQSVDRRDAAL